MNATTTLLPGSSNVPFFQSSGYILKHNPTTFMHNQNFHNMYSIGGNECGYHDDYKGRSFGRGRNRGKSGRNWKPVC